MAVISCNTSEPIYFIKIVERNVAKENLRDRFGHEIFPGECVSRDFICRRVSKESFLLTFH